MWPNWWLPGHTYPSSVAMPVERNGDQEARDAPGSYFEPAFESFAFCNCKPTSDKRWRSRRSHGQSKQRAHASESRGAKKGSYGDIYYLIKIMRGNYPRGVRGSFIHAQVVTQNATRIQAFVVRKPTRILTSYTCSTHILQSLAEPSRLGNLLIRITEILG